MADFLELKALDLSPVFTDLEITDFYVAIFPSVARLVSRLGGSLEEAKDIFHDALIIHWEQQSKNPDKIYGSEAGYILGIAKNLCIRQYQRGKKVISLSDAEQEIPIPPDFYPTVRQRRLLRVLERTGKKCLDLLRAFYYQMVPLREIAHDFKYANEHSASVQKYKCLDKVKKIVAEKSLNYEDFLE